MGVSFWTCSSILWEGRKKESEREKSEVKKKIKVKKK